jgi:ABC-type multidrug transport system fused ATPase/permease subunit
MKRSKLRCVSSSPACVQFNTTIAENIAYGAPSHTQAELNAAAKAAQAYSFIEGFEDGMATRVGERGQRLSGGQKQRLASKDAHSKTPPSCGSPRSLASLLGRTALAARG